LHSAHLFTLGIPLPIDVPLLVDVPSFANSLLVIGIPVLVDMLSVDNVPLLVDVLLVDVTLAADVIFPVVATSLV
jgi:hypothetical protein